MDHVAAANEYAARLVGAHVYQLRVANALTLDFDNGVRLIIETPLSASSSAGTWTGEPTDGGSIDVLFPLLYQPTTSAKVHADGSIRLTFSDGAVEVKPDPMYEAWQLATTENWMAICTPGGGLAFWQ